LLPVEFSRLVDIGRSKRQEIARELVNGRGMSRRQAAKLLGVGEATVRRDVRNDSANGAEKLRTTRELLAQSH
jgi:predicted transcriptional regulator